MSPRSDIPYGRRGGGWLDKGATTSKEGEPVRVSCGCEVGWWVGWVPLGRPCERCGDQMIEMAE